MGRKQWPRPRRLGAVPEAPSRAAETMRRTASALGSAIEVMAAPHEMGHDVAREAGFSPTMVGLETQSATTASDTEDAARLMADLGADLLLFAGGDGTARDIYHAIGNRLPVVGIPAGVKMHSGVYATSPRAAADLVVRFFHDESMELREVEVMDIDEEAFRRDTVSAKLYGYLRVPHEGALVQGAKAGSTGDEEAAFEDVAAGFVDNMRDDWLYVVGPGTTTRAITRRLGLEKTLLGVDLVRGQELIGVDVTEFEIIEALEGQTAKIVVTPIGGQRHIFGRGNQQISPSVIKQVGREHITLVATEQKLTSFRGAPLLIDTGDAELDAALSGYFRVVTGYRREFVYKASA